ncbi:MAG: TIGR00297 family protein [Acidobacteriota bacterium]
MSTSRPLIGVLTAGELARKVVHMGVGTIAFAVAYLGPTWSAVCALAALLANLFVLPHVGGRRLWREHETKKGSSIGIVLYPFTILLLILFYWQRLEVATAVWGILAFGDGMASVVGQAIGKNKLGWNPKKSWEGTIAYWLFGTIAASTLLVWTARIAYQREVDLGFAIAVGAIAALFAAAIESLPQGIDDNLGVPLLTSLVVLGLVQSQDVWPTLDLQALLIAAAIGGAINAALAVPAYLAKSVSLSGMIAGWIIGVMIWTFGGWQSFLLLLAFFVAGTAATKLGYRRKAKEKLAQEAGGRRGAKHALANTSVAAVAAVFAMITPHETIYFLAFAAAFATALGDTLGSEIGQLYGRRTFLITTLKPVPRGTEGAVSLEGTLAGLAGSIAIATLGWATGLYPVLGIVVVSIAAFLGTTLESVIGATLEKRGLLDNEAVNFLNTLTGALLAVAIGWLVL